MATTHKPVRYTGTSGTQSPRAGGPASPRAGGPASPRGARASQTGFSGLVKKMSSRHKTAEEELESTLARADSNDSAKGDQHSKLGTLTKKLSQILPTQQDKQNSNVSFYKHKHTIVNKQEKSPAEWKDILKKYQYVCLIERKMEPEDSVKKNYLTMTEEPKSVLFYFCACCGTPVFCAKDRLEGEGAYLTFVDGLPDAVINISGSLGNIVRIEAECAGCHSFLGEYISMHYKNRKVRVNTHGVKALSIPENDLNKIFAK